jgi:hypothetical protein
MTIDRRHIGHVLAPYAVPVEASRLRFFAKATGQTDPVYTDDAAARAAATRQPPHPARRAGLQLRTPGACR